MTDEQIIKALECCATDKTDDCFRCPYDKMVYNPGYGWCADRCREDALDLISRKDNEIKKLKKELDELEISADITETIIEEKNADISELIFKERDNAVREFADMLKQYADNYGSGDEFIAVSVIDDVMKDMTRSDDE